MPDRRRHRGRHPADDELFAPAAVARLDAAAADLSWLLDRGYVLPSALKLVGDRYDLRQRQRLAVLRVTAGASAARDRRLRELTPEAAHGLPLLVDGYNVLITVEAAMAGGVLLLGEDGCLRDLASLHGSFKQVEETRPALEAIGGWLARTGIGPVRLLLDRPVSNSGRLAAAMRRLATARGWPWSVDIETDPDAVLRTSSDLVATADSVVLDAPVRWLNLARHVVKAACPTAPILAFPAAIRRGEGDRA